MLTFKKLTAPKNRSIQGVVNYLKETAEYYEQGQSLPAYWQGHGIDASGLNDPDRDANSDFAKLLAGFDPITNKSKKNLTKKSVVAIDLTASCPKGFSIALASCTDDALRQQMIGAMKEANDFALAYVIDNLTCRTGARGKGKAISPAQTYARSVMHLDSRDGDAQAHFHNALVNTGIDEDGKARCLDMDRVVRMRPVASALFDARLAYNFQQLGLGVERAIERNEYGEETGDVSYSIAGIDRTTEMEFSSRRQDIEQAKEEARKDGRTLTGSQANILTRKGKDNELTPLEIMRSTQQRANALHKQRSIDWEASQELIGRKGHVETQTIEEIALGMHENESMFSRDQLLAKVAEKGDLSLDPVEATDAFLARGHGLIQLKEKNLYCTTEQREIERDCVLSAIRRQDEPRHELDPDTVARAIRAQEAELGHSLDQEQANAVRHACECSGGFAVIEGNAGTGKTATAGAYVKAHQEAGYTVLGASTSQVATENLASEVNGKDAQRKPSLADEWNRSAPKDKQMQAFNTANLLIELDSGRLKLSDKHLLVLDEAGMVGARTMHRIQQHIDKAGAKIVAVGDSKQLQPIEAGNPFYLIGNTIGKARIETIRRQKNQEHLDVANALYDEAKNGRELVGMMKAKGMIVEGTNKQDAMSKLVGAYLSDTNDQRNKLILASTHNDNDALTERLRKQLDQAGKLGERQRIVTARTDNKKLKLDEKEVAVNDRIRFTRNQKNLGLRNNDLATVVGFGQEKNKRFIKVRMDTDPSKVKEIPLKEKNHFVFGYARTTHSAQGLGEKNVYALATQSRALDRNMVMVNFTRTKEQFRYFGTEQEFNGVAEKIDNFQTKKSIHELLPEHLRRGDEQMFKRALAQKRQHVAELFPQAKAKRKQRAQAVQSGAAKICDDFQEKLDALDQAKASCKEITGEKKKVDEKKQRYSNERSSLGIFQRKERRELDATLASLMTLRDNLAVEHKMAYRNQQLLEAEINQLKPKAIEAVKVYEKQENELSYLEKPKAYRDYLEDLYTGGEIQAQRDRKLLHGPSPGQRLDRAIEQRKERKQALTRALEQAQSPRELYQQAPKRTIEKPAPILEQKRQRQRARGLGLSR